MASTGSVQIVSPVPFLQLCLANILCTLPQKTTNFLHPSISASISTKFSCPEDGGSAFWGNIQTNTLHYIVQDLSGLPREFPTMKLSFSDC